MLVLKRAKRPIAAFDVSYYNIIYDAVDDVKATMSGMLSPDEEEVISVAEIRNIHCWLQDRYGGRLYGRMGTFAHPQPTSACCATT